VPWGICSGMISQSRRVEVSRQSFWVDTQLSKPCSQTLGTSACFVSMLLFGSAFLDPICKSQKRFSVGIEDSPVLGAVSRVETDSETRTDEAGHLGDFLQMISQALPALQEPVVRVVDVVFLYAISLVELKSAAHFGGPIAWRKDFKKAGSWSP
jgi:hypothetical protein